MSNSTTFKLKREEAFELYLGGKTDPKDLASTLGISPITASKWIKAGKWETLQKEESRLLKDIETARKKALLQALREYAKDPGNTALQSLVSLIRQDQRRNEPAKELNDYIVKFMDQTTDFMIEKGFSGLLKQFQGILLDLAEYLRIRNA